MLAFKASQELIPKIKTGIVNGKISKGEITFPVFAPRVKDEQIDPIRHMPRLPIRKINKFHKIKFRLMPKNNDKIGNTTNIGKISENQKVKHFISKIISSKIGQ